jgi:butyrate kinase
MRIFVNNPGGTSTKVGIFEGEKEIKTEVIRHKQAELNACGGTLDQLEFRMKFIEELLAEWGVEYDEIDAAVGRGGPFLPLDDGTYEVNDALVEDIYEGNYQADHPSLLGALIAREVAKKAGCKAYFVDPVSVDEFHILARFSGLPDLERKSLFHALNIFAVMRLVIRDLGAELDEFNAVGVHLGSGITVAAIEKGRVVDVNNAMDGGPMAPTRAASTPTSQLIDLCYSGKYNHKEMKTRCCKEGGLYAYLGTNSLIEVEERIAAGDEWARLVFDAMVYQIAKEIGAMATVLDGVLYCIYLTGAMANSEMLCDEVRERVEWLGDVRVYPGDDEMWALAAGVTAVLDGDEEAMTYERGGMKREDLLYEFRKEHGFL